MYCATVLCCHVMNTVLSSKFYSLRESSSSVYITLLPCSVMVDSLWGARSHSGETPPRFAPCMGSSPMYMGRPRSSSTWKIHSEGSWMWFRVGMSCPPSWQSFFGSRRGITGPSERWVPPGAWPAFGRPAAFNPHILKHIGSVLPWKIPPGMLPQPSPLYPKGVWPRLPQYPKPWQYHVIG